MIELPPLDGDSDERSLGWVALNYRTAHTVNAQGQYEQLERFVREYGLACRRAALEEAAQVCDEAAAQSRRMDWPDFAVAESGCADAIRAAAEIGSGGGRDAAA
jgi:hypothetical protein